MEVKLISHDNQVLLKTHKGPLHLHPTGKWRAVEMTISDYNIYVKSIVIAHSTAPHGEESNAIEVTGAVVKMGHRPGICAEVFSLSRRDSHTTGQRTCLIHVHSPNVQDFFSKWKIEWSKTDSNGENSSKPECHYKMISNQRNHFIALKIPAGPIHLNVYAVGKCGTMQAIGELTLPHADGKYYNRISIIRTLD